ncbi:MAG: hypothetical protein IT287_04985 [Bdellovibrionaceae bacterium]|nr:hypothetical protein [Pseudobdellovibrionaceae bacterium]
MTYIRQLLLVCIFLFSNPLWANRKEGVQLKSAVDDSLTVHTVLLMPTVDNVDGIFSRPFDKALGEKLSSDKQWQLVGTHMTSSMILPSELVNSPEKVKKIASSSKADALFLAEVRKNPKDFILALFLFSTKDGRLISQAAASDLDQSSIDRATKQLFSLYDELKFRVPYEGLILSRTKNRVTINLGATDGLTPGQELACSRIIQVTRHPKLGTIIQNEKVMIGKIKLVKVDKNLSFGDIISEIELSAIQKDAKITGAKPLNYAQESWIKKDDMPAEMLLSQDNLVNGKVQEWRPELPPTFGMVGANLSLGPFKQTLSLTNGESYTTKSSLYPTVNLYGEIWINPEWFVTASFGQGTASVKNPVGGGNPGDLTTSLSQYSLDVGYNLLLKDDFFDSKLIMGFGFYNYRMSIDDSSPEGLMSSEYSSPRLILGARTPIDENNRWFLGGMLYWYISSGLKERPLSSGSEDSRMVQYTLQLDYRWSERIFINSALDFKTFSTDFSGGGTRLVPATTGSHRFQNIVFGASYMF